MSEQVGTDEALWAGRVSVYRTGDGGVVIAHQMDGSGEVTNHHIAPFMVKMLEKAAEGKGSMAALLGGRRGT